MRLWLYCTLQVGFHKETDSTHLVVESFEAYEVIDWPTCSKNHKTTAARFLVTTYLQSTVMHGSLGFMANNHLTPRFIQHVPSHSQTCSCQQSNAYFEGISLERVPCEFGNLAPGYCTLLYSERENCVVSCQNFLLRYFIFANGWKLVKFVKLKTSKNLAIYGSLQMDINDSNSNN